jgi:hypothetical protein
VYVAGFDLSLTRSGVAHAGDRSGSATLGREGITKLPLSQRFHTIKTMATDLVILGTSPDILGISPTMWTERVPDYRAREMPALAVIEAPDTSHSYGGLPERLYMYGCVLESLSAMGIPIATIPSPILKGYATGNGGHKGGKLRIKEGAAENWPEYFADRRKVTHDEVDAIVLARMGWDWLSGQSRVPAEQRAKWLARAGTDWPAELDAYADEAA